MLRIIWAQASLRWFKDLVSSQGHTVRKAGGHIGHDDVTYPRSYLRPFILHSAECTESGSRRPHRIIGPRKSLFWAAQRCQLMVAQCPKQSRDVALHAILILHAARSTALPACSFLVCRCMCCAIGDILRDSRSALLRINRLYSLISIEEHTYCSLARLQCAGGNRNTSMYHDVITTASLHGVREWRVT